MHLNLLLLVFISQCFSVSYQQLTEMKQILPGTFPYVALIGAQIACHGVLITENYLLTNARCVCVSELKLIKIYLGWYSSPVYYDPTNKAGMQVYSPSAVTCHPDYNHGISLNDIALVKLPVAVSVTPFVKLGKLADPKTFKNKNLTGQYGTVFGWGPAEYLLAATVEIRSHGDCRHIFGQNYQGERQLCVKWPTGPRLCSDVSILIEINGSFIGLMADDPKNTLCESYENKFLNILAYYDWIINNSDLREYIQENYYADVTFHAIANIHDVGIKFQTADAKTVMRNDISSKISIKESSSQRSAQNEELKILSFSEPSEPKRRCKIDIEVACPKNKES